MKAWLVKEKDEFSAEVVFAETRGKAKSLARYTDACWDTAFVNIQATREPTIDKFYQEGKWRLDWEDADDRQLLVSICGFRCEYIDIDLCKVCSAKDSCDAYQDYLLEEKHTC